MTAAPTPSQPTAQATQALTWEPSKHRHSNGETLRLGRYPVGEWQLDAELRKGARASFAVTCRLPGVRPDLGHCETSDKARSLLEKVVMGWVNSAGLTFTAPETTACGENA